MRPSASRPRWKELKALNIEYASKRKSARLGPLAAVTLAPGTLDQSERDIVNKRRGRSEQYKHKYLVQEVLAE